jgi:hypothetical protein
MIVLFHHPVVGQHAEARERFVQIMRLGPTDELIHGALIAMLVVLASAMAVFNVALDMLTLTVCLWPKAPQG